MITSTYAVIDIGTNSVKLLITDINNDIRTIYEQIEITQLGKNLSKNKTLKNNVIKETINVLNKFLQICRKYDATKTFTIGTKALRIAKNSDIFTQKCNRIGLQPEIISGLEEAKLAYLGGTYDIKTSNNAVIDIGGGSTEIVYFRNKLFPKSLSIGAVTLTEKFIKSDPPANSEIIKMKDYIRKSIQCIDNIKARTLIGIGGTITTLAAINNKSFNNIHKTILSQTQIEKMFNMLSAIPIAKRCKIKGLEPKRADIIIAGTLILIEAMKILRVKEIIVSTKGIRHGLLIDKLSCIQPKLKLR